jgi:hypothetical protein
MEEDPVSGVILAGAILLFFIFILGLLLGWLLKSPRVPVEPVRPPQPPPSCPPFKVSDTFDEKGLTSTLNLRLAGVPADGSAPTVGAAPQKVIWVDHGDEVLVHLDSMQTRILDRTLLVSIDLETDQTGRTPLVVAFALGNTNDPAGLVAVTDELPRGNGVLASRWGRVVQDAIWASMLGLAGDHASERDAAPLAITLSPGSLHLHAAPAASVAAPPPAGAAR